jgi:type IV secretory pathway VirB3-like protein
MAELLPPAASAAIAAVFNAVESLSPFAERTVILIPSFLNDAVSYIANSTGFSDKMIAFTAVSFMNESNYSKYSLTHQFSQATFLCYALAFLMNLVPYGLPKHAAILQLTIGQQWLHMLVSSTICYIFFVVLSPKRAVVVVPIFVMAYLSMGHLHRMFSSYNKWSLNFTTPQMDATIKLYSLAYNMYDGERLLESQRKNREVDRGVQRCAKYAVFTLPNPIEYLGYVFCFSTILAGPAIEFKTYTDACSGALLYTPDGNLRGKLPSRFWPTLGPFLASVACMGL